MSFGCFGPYFFTPAFFAHRTQAFTVCGFSDFSQISKASTKVTPQNIGFLSAECGTVQARRKFAKLLSVTLKSSSSFGQTASLVLPTKRTWFRLESDAVWTMVSTMHYYSIYSQMDSRQIWLLLRKIQIIFTEYFET